MNKRNENIGMVAGYENDFMEGNTLYINEQFFGKEIYVNSVTTFRIEKRRIE